MNSENLQELSFEILTNLHKLEGQEALTYLTILFTVVIGIIGFLGSTQRIEKSARMLILFFYTGLHLTMVTSFIASMKMHSAIHEEIAIYVTNNSKIFIEDSESALFIELSNLHPHNIVLMEVAGYLLLIFMILCILSIGPNSMLNWTKFERIFKKIKK